MLLKLCPECLMCIMSFLDNKTNSNIVSTCRSLQEHGKKNGYLNEIKVDFSVDIREVIYLFSINEKTVKTVTMDGFENPHLWVPIFKEKMFFTNCSFPDRLSPGKVGRSTKYIVITDYHRYKNKLTLEINWQDFPNLEYLELYVHNLKIKGIDQCKELRKVKINTTKYKIVGNVNEDDLWYLLLNPPHKTRKLL